MGKEETVWMIIVPFVEKESAERVAKRIGFKTDIIKVKESEYKKLREKSK